MWVIDVLLEFLAPIGDIGMLIFTFIAFAIDSIGIPMFPDIVYSIVFVYKPTLMWGAIMIVVISIAECAGMYILYLIVEHTGVPPRINKWANRYINFLICSDERMLLVNRVAPMIMFAGAFVSIIDSWKITKAMFWNAIGCFIKYTSLTLVSYYFFQAFDVQEAQKYTILLAISVMIICFTLSFIKKKLDGWDTEKEPTEEE